MERKNKSTDDLMDSLTQSQDLQSFMNENDSDFRQDVGAKNAIMETDEHTREFR